MFVKKIKCVIRVRIRPQEGNGVTVLNIFFTFTLILPCNGLNNVECSLIRNPFVYLRGLQR